jgi:hypothetical protein
VVAREKGEKENKEGRRDARGNYYRYDPAVTADAAKVSLDFFDRNLSGQPRR